MNSLIKRLPHVSAEPLRIERELEEGREIIVVEGVRYDADYFRTFAHPDAGVLYAVRKDADGVVCLTIVPTADEAKQFFDPTPPPPPYGHLPQMRGEHPNLGEEEQYEEMNDVL